MAANQITSKFLKTILAEIRVELLDEFDRNFERKAFFNRKWPERKTGQRGTLMVVRGGGGLRGSIKATVNQNTVVFSSHLPYAKLHNEGGTLKVTAKMKRFFWAKYYELAGKKKSRKTNLQAEFYKNMALMKVGSTITMPQRQFIGHSREVDIAVEQVINQGLKTLETYLNQSLKPKAK